jgi:hypothetical protein
MKYFPSAVLAVFLVAVPSAVSACTVCFGGPDSDLVKGFTWGVAILGALPFLLAAVLITKIAHHTRKRNAS